MLGFANIWSRVLDYYINDLRVIFSFTFIAIGGVYGV